MIIALLAAFGMTFIIQNKIPILHTWAKGQSVGSRFLAKLLGCTFCLGFWTGWATWGMSWGVTGRPVFGSMAGSWIRLGAAGIMWALTSAVTSYFLFVSIVWLEESLGPSHE